MSSDQTLSTAETSPIATGPPSVDLLHCTTNVCQHHQHRHHHQHVDQQLPVHRHCDMSSCVGDVGGRHTQTVGDSDTEACHRHCTPGHAADDNYLMPRALCVGKRSSRHMDDRHLYTPLPVTYLDRSAVTSLCDDVSDDIDAGDGDELQAAMSVTYTSSGCCMTPAPVRVVSNSVSGGGGVKLDDVGRPHDDAVVKLRRLLCCRKRDKKFAHLATCKRRGGCGAMETCYRLADDVVTGQRKTLVVLGVVVVTVFGALSGLLLGFTLLQQISQHALDTQQDCPESLPVTCDDVSCVDMCADLRRRCPQSLELLVCANNTGSDSVDKGKALPPVHQASLSPALVVDYLNVESRLEKPVPDEQGWVEYSRGSLNGSKYTVIDKSMTFYGAQDQCRKYGGYLAHVNTIREQVFLENFLIHELQLHEKLLDGVGFWIGARRPRGGHSGSCMFDQWKWVDSYGRTHGTIAGFTAFIPGKPDNFYTPEECLYLSFSEGTEENRFLKWDDAPCDLSSIGGIKILCEVELGH